MAQLIARKIKPEPVVRLDLSNNRLTALDPGLFEGLTALRSLRLAGNPADPLPITISLKAVGAGGFRAEAHTGAPFDIVLPLQVPEGLLAGGTSAVTIPIGRRTSDTLFVAGTAPDTVGVDIGPLPGLARYHGGYSLVRSADLPLQLITRPPGPETAVAFTASGVPAASGLDPSFPNPFNGGTRIALPPVRPRSGAAGDPQRPGPAGAHPGRRGPGARLLRGLLGCPRRAGDGGGVGGVSGAPPLSGRCAEPGTALPRVAPLIAGQEVIP